MTVTVDLFRNESDRAEAVPAGHTLFAEGTHGEMMFVVIEGEVELRVRGQVVDRVGPGGVLGEMSLIDSSPAAASIRVDQDSLVLAIPKSRLQGKLQSDTAFAARFYRALCMFMATRMRGTIRRMGYQDANASVDLDPDELDVDTLDQVHLAGARFERMLKRLAGV
ncbi:MAG: cyclic nucleotide-binding domain-containing protein [Pseudomonadota bacterium]